MIPHGPMEQNLGIDTKIKSVALSDPNYNLAGVLPTLLSLIMATTAKMATQVSLRCLKVVPSDSPCPKAWG